jgi:N-acetylglucosaminyldiphosphoundecaprenol N-acetyl-beta-D-mannosaminyltransferase
MDHSEIERRVREAKPDILFVCFGCPKQEKWIAMHYRSLGVPVSIGVGGTIDFLAGRLARAPLWMRRTGSEWMFRLAQEPRRLFKRYVRDFWYFGWHLTAQLLRTRLRRGRQGRGQSVPSERVDNGQVISCPEWLDALAVKQSARTWEEAVMQPRDLLIDLARVRFIDSTGAGLLVRFRKRAGITGHHLVLLAPSSAVERVLKAMRLWDFFLTAADRSEAARLLDNLATGPAVIQPAPLGSGSTLAWQGEVTAATADEVWEITETFLRSIRPAERARIDLSRVTFLDSTGLGLMIQARKMARNGGLRLTFAGINQNVLNVIRISKLDSYLMEESHSSLSFGEAARA